MANEVRTGAPVNTKSLAAFLFNEMERLLGIPVVGISASRNEMLGSTLYLYGFENGKPLVKAEPCVMCSRMIKNAGIAMVINQTEDRPV